MAGMGVWLRRETVVGPELGMASLRKLRSCLVVAGWGCAHTGEVGSGVALCITQIMEA